MMEKECFAYKNGGCIALNVKKCEGTSCGFFKTKAQLIEEQERVFKRIQSLDKSSKVNIMALYYKGKRNLR